MYPSIAILQTMSVPETHLERFYQQCGNAVRIKIEMKDENGFLFLNQIRETNILMSVCKAANLNINKIETLGELPDRKGNWFIQLVDSVNEDEKKTLLGVSGIYIDGNNKPNRKFSITDIADGDELIEMKFAIHFLPVNFDLKKVKEYFERINFTGVSVFRNKIKLDAELFDDLDSPKEIYTNLIFVKAKLKKQEKSPIVCGYRKLFGYEPRIDILDRIKRCRLCKKEGHIVDTCKGKGVYCAKCKQQGHSENECSIAYLLQKGLYSQIENFDDSDEMKFNCLTSEILERKKEQWKKTKIFKEKKEQKKINKEKNLKEKNEKTSLFEMNLNPKNPDENEENYRNSDSEMELDYKLQNEKRNHSDISSVNSSPSDIININKKNKNDRNMRVEILDIILEVYAERNEIAFNMSEAKKNKIENAFYEETKNIKEFTEKTKANIKNSFITLFNNCEVKPAFL